MQQRRQMYQRGGIMEVAPRQGAIFGGLKKAIGSAFGSAKKLLKSPLGKAALLAGGAYFAPTLFGKPAGFGSFGNLVKGGITNLGGMMGLGSEKGDLLGNVLKVGGYGTLLGGALAGMGDDEQGPIGGQRNIGALRIRLEKAYRELGYDESEIPGLVEADLAEYTQGAGGYANGGRIGYSFGTPEDNAIRAAGIMNLPLNQNPAGVTELDLRETGGFIPPVGIKEKADDIPAMLSNNEFVMTADAVKQFGDGDVNKGAQRMYAMMKKLENGGRV